uniref:Uncharacterized protein n=1 Tax=Oryza brachyantha TaxID=4533 RepID=J3MQV3_ORYBR
MHVVGAADLDEHPLRVAGVATGDEGVGRVREDQRAERDDERRHAGEPQPDAPPPSALEVRRRVVDEVRREDADGGHELEPDVEHPAHVRRGHLRQVERHRLVGEPDADPTPSRMRPRMSIITSVAAPLSAEPARNVMPPQNMDHFRPNTRVTHAATNDVASAARYSDDVNSVSSWLLNLQYWLVSLLAFALAYTDGKNSLRNESMDVTPPEMPMS